MVNDNIITLCKIANGQSNNSNMHFSFTPVSTGEIVSLSFFFFPFALGLTISDESRFSKSTPARDLPLLWDGTRDRWGSDYGRSAGTLPVSHMYRKTAYSWQDERELKANSAKVHFLSHLHIDITQNYILAEDSRSRKGVGIEMREGWQEIILRFSCRPAC
jgi:hypothetical protein